MQKKRIRNDAIRQRLNLIRLAKKLGASRACERLGKHPSYYYYWKKRYEAGGWRALQDRSRRPKSMPRLSGEDKVKAVVKMRKQTGYGKERLSIYLEEQGVKIPASTVGNILKRAGLLLKKRRYKTQKKHVKRYNLLYPGQRVQMDIKYVPMELCPPGQQYYQYTVIDEHTRLRYLAWHDSIWTLNSVKTLKRAEKYFGFKIESVQTDNGIEFTFNYTAQLTAQHQEPKEHPLDIYCQQKNLQHKLIPPGQKEINGKVERSHRIDDEEFYRRHKRFKNLKSLRRKGRKWLYDYNFNRKHSALNYMTPNAFAKFRLYFPDQNPMPSKMC